MGEFAERTATIKEEVSLIDETANICRGTDRPGDGGFIGDLQDIGWEIQNKTLVQVADTSKRNSIVSQVLIMRGIMRRACFDIFNDGFPYAEMAEWLAMYLLNHP